MSIGRQTTTLLTFVILVQLVCLSPVQAERGGGFGSSFRSQTPSALTRRNGSARELWVQEVMRRMSTRGTGSSEQLQLAQRALEAAGISRSLNPNEIAAIRRYTSNAEMSRSQVEMAAQALNRIRQAAAQGLTVENNGTVSYRTRPSVERSQVLELLPQATRVRALGTALESSNLESAIHSLETGRTAHESQLRDTIVDLYSRGIGTGQPVTNMEASLLGVTRQMNHARTSPVKKAQMAQIARMILRGEGQARNTRGQAVATEIHTQLTRLEASANNPRALEGYARLAEVVNTAMDSAVGNRGTVSGDAAFRQAMRELRSVRYGARRGSTSAEQKAADQALMAAINRVVERLNLSPELARAVSQFKFLLEMKRAGILDMRSLMTLLLGARETRTARRNRNRRANEPESERRVPCTNNNYMKRLLIGLAGSGAATAVGTTLGALLGEALTPQEQTTLRNEVVAMAGQRAPEVRTTNEPAHNGGDGNSNSGRGRGRRNSQFSVGNI